VLEKPSQAILPCAMARAHQWGLRQKVARQWRATFSIFQGIFFRKLRFMIFPELQ
jgi:hypothetical protein